MVSSTQVQGRQVLEMKFSCSDCFHLCIGRKTKKARKMSILTYLRTVDSLILEYFMIFHCVFFLVQYGPMLNLKNQSEHPMSRGSDPPMHRKARGVPWWTGWTGHGSLWRHCGNGETTELRLLLFKHVYCFANVCHFWVETCWNQWLESQSHKADLWNGGKKPHVAYKSLFVKKTLVPLKWLVCCDVLVRKGPGTRIQHFRASTVSRPSS